VLIVPAILALMSSVMWGVSDYLGGAVTRRLAPVVVVGWSQFIGMLFMVVIATFAHAWSDPLGYLPWAVLASLSGLIGLLAFYRALADGSMGIVAPIASLGSLVPVAAGLITGDRPQPWQLVGVLVALVGIVLASGPELSGGTGRRNVLLALFSAAVFGVALLAVAKGSATSPAMTMLGMRVVTVTIVGTVALTRRNIGGVAARDFRFLLPIGVFDVGANVMYGYATTKGLLSLVAVLGSLYPVMTVGLAWRIDHERLARIQYVGVLATLFGAALISVGGPGG
jgi:drug/metabolite transporter (DMT)-like permease